MIIICYAYGAVDTTMTLYGTCDDSLSSPDYYLFSTPVDYMAL